MSGGGSQAKRQPGNEAPSVNMAKFFEPKFEPARSHQDATHFYYRNEYAAVKITGLLQGAGLEWIFTEDGKRLEVGTLNEARVEWLVKVEPDTIPDHHPFGRGYCIIVPPDIDVKRPFTVKFEQEPVKEPFKLEYRVTR